MKNPIQPLYKDEHGTVRFKENALVRYLLDEGGLDMNKLAYVEASQDDREQFAQLIGYSLSGFSELSYVGDETYGAATIMSEDKEMPSIEARVDVMRTELADLRESLAPAIANLYGIAVEDLDSGRG